VFVVYCSPSITRLIIWRRMRWARRGETCTLFGPKICILLKMPLWRLGVDGRIILKWTLGKGVLRVYCMNVTVGVVLSLPFPAQCYGLGFRRCTDFPDTLLKRTFFSNCLIHLVC
jgi:hypothetical protein